MATKIDKARFTLVRRRIEPNARVWCPRLQRHVDVERCFDCVWQNGVSNGPPRPYPYIVCGAPRA